MGGVETEVQRFFSLRAKESALMFAAFISARVHLMLVHDLHLLKLEE